MASHIGEGWTTPPVDLRIAGGAVHLWRVDLRGILPENFTEVLAQDELARAGRFKFKEDRQRFLLSGYALRDILSRYTGTSPGGVPIAVSAKGKPYLGEGVGGGQIHFNLAHSSWMAAVAVANARVGVDVERMAEDYPHMQVAESFFSAREAEALSGEAEPSQRVKLFFSYWTRKEALLKAAGEGLYEDLSRIDLSGAGSVVEYGGSRWTVTELEPEGDILCSVALEGMMSGIERYVWEPRQPP